MTEEIVVTDTEKWIFSEKDCEVILPVNPRTGKSYRFPAMNGEFSLEGKPGAESEGAQKARRVVVRHVPTGLEAVEDRFLPYRNKEIAMKKLETIVGEWIEREEQARTSQE